MRKVCIKIVMMSLLLIISSCSSEEYVNLSIEGAEIRAKIPEVFRKQGIWFKQLKDGRVRAKRVDVPRIQAALAEIRESIIPFGRSRGYGPEMEAIMLRRLRANNVPHEVRRFDGIGWIIWNSEHEKQIRVIEQQASEELHAILMQELANEQSHNK